MSAPSFEEVKKEFQNRLGEKGSNILSRLCLPWESTVHSHFGAKAYVVRVASDNVMSFSPKAQVCHGFLNSSHERDSFATFSFPFSDGVLAKPSVNPYPKGFLDGFYTWLTTESPVSSVFFEPWNGMYLCVDHSKPRDLILLALMLSRFPTERITKLKHRWPLFKVRGLGWFASILACCDWYTINQNITTPYRCNADGHSPLRRAFMSDEDVHNILFERKIEGKLPRLNELDKHSWGGVWNLYNNVEILKDKLPQFHYSKFHKGLQEGLKELLGMKGVVTGWGEILETPSKKDVTQDQHDEFVLNYYLSYIEEQKNVSVKESA